MSESLEEHLKVTADLVNFNHEDSLRVWHGSDSSQDSISRRWLLQVIVILSDCVLLNIREGVANIIVIVVLLGLLLSKMLEMIGNTASRSEFYCCPSAMIMLLFLITLLYIGEYFF